MEDLKPVADELKQSMIVTAVRIADEIPPALFLRFLNVTDGRQSAAERIASVRAAVGDPHLVQLIVIALTIGSVEIGGAWSNMMATKAVGAR